jgi:hypothetical protein
MTGYKRNQVEEAISGVLEPTSPEPSSELRTQLKRLLDTDRSFGRTPRSDNAERANYAFYSDDAPGSGIEVWFSEYEAFALVNGLFLMRHGWPQSFAVSVMRRVRLELERQHARVMKLDPKKLFDQDAIMNKARPGDMAFDNVDPVLLIIVSRPGRASNEQEQPIECSICRGPEQVGQYLRVIRQRLGLGAVTMFDVTTIAHKLSAELVRTEPRRRGRG